MGSVKFYTIEDWVEAYLKEWGYDHPTWTSDLIERLKKEKNNLHPDDVLAFLDQHIQSYINTILPEVGLSDIQKFNYFKMIFLMQKLYQKINLFDEIAPADEKILIDCFQKQLYQVAPDLIQANMFRQSIKTFHPVWKIKKTFAKGLKKVVRAVSKK